MRALRTFLIISLISPASTFAQTVSGATFANATANVAIKVDPTVLTNSTNALASPIGTPLKALASELVPLAQACNTEKVQTDGVCSEATNPGLLGFMNEYGPLVQMGSTMMSMNDACSSMADILNKASLALTAYQAACGLAMTKCQTSCGQLKTKLAAFQAKLQSTQVSLESACAAESAMNPGNWYCTDAIQITEINSAVQQVQGAQGKVALACAGYEANKKNALSGIMQSVIGMSQAKNCSDTLGSGAGEAIAACVDPNNVQYNSVNCKCSRNELTAAECQRISVAGVGSQGASQVQVGDAASASSGSALTDPNASGVVSEGQASSTSPASSLAGAPVSGGGLSGGGGSGMSAQDGSGVNRRINANVLGGFGGGGGGGTGGSGPGYGEVDKQLQEHGPGGAKDPKRTLASQLAKQVTGGAGRSNWEKVRDRYRDNRRTLLLNK